MQRTIKTFILDSITFATFNILKRGDTMPFEDKLRKYNQIKIDLLKMSKHLDFCDETEKNLYQNICVEYTKELKEIKKSLEQTYGIEICNSDTRK